MCTNTFSISTKISLASIFLISVFFIALSAAFTPVPANAISVPPKCFVKKNADNRIIIKDATPDKMVLILLGFKTGNAALNNTACPGLPIGIANSRKIAKVRMNSEGDKKAKVKIPSTPENMGYIQMVDLSTCTAGPIGKAVLTSGKIPNGRGCTYGFGNELDKCPCFDASMIEGQGIDFDAESLSGVSCNNNFPDGAFIAGDRPGGFNWSVAAFDDLSGRECSMDDEENGISPNAFGITEAQYLDCQSIILNSIMWGINCTT